jgi:hypothetical protein
MLPETVFGQTLLLAWQYGVIWCYLEGIFCHIVVHDLSDAPCLYHVTIIVLMIELLGYVVAGPFFPYHVA